MKLKEAGSALKKVFSNWKYILLSLAIAAAFYALYIFFTDYKQVSLIFSSYGLLKTLTSLPFLTSFFPLRSILGFIAMSLLLGVLFSLIIYKTKMLKSASGKTGLWVSLGIFIGILAPGCPVCGIGLLSILGLGSAATPFLPFKGFGLLILSMGILSLSIYKVSKDINRGIICEIKLPKG